MREEHSNRFKRRKPAYGEAHAEGQTRFDGALPALKQLKSTPTAEGAIN